MTDLENTARIALPAYIQECAGSAPARVRALPAYIQECAGSAPARVRVESLFGTES